MSNEGLHKQRKGGKSAEDVERIAAMAAAHPGDTVTQLAWRCIGFDVDDQGYCQPRETFNRMIDFFNLKRRASECAWHVDELDEHPRARLQYGKAKCNPYSNGGAGVYPLGPMVGSPLVVKVDDVVVPEPVQAKPVDVSGLLDLLD